MTCTIVAQIVDKLGTACWWWTGTYGGRHLEEIRSHPSASFDDIQPGVIPITLRHGGSPLGHISYLEHGISSSDLTAVAVVDVEPEAVAGLFASGEITAAMPRGGMIAERCRLDGLALVGRTAGIAATPVRAFARDYRYSQDMGFSAPSILQRAREAHRTETRSDTMRIHRPVRAEERLAVDLVPLPTTADLSRRLEIRSAPTLDVHERQRIIEVIAAPTDTIADVIIRGRVVTEQFGVAAFAGDEHRAARIKTNREHDPNKVVGRCVAVDPYTQVGAVATMKISGTVLGDETLELARDRVLDASAGFRVAENGERWNSSQTHRVITAARFDHIALCQSPAYESAAILDVRSF